jgi:hypothetical protein
MDSGAGVARLLVASAGLGVFGLYANCQLLACRVGFANDVEAPTGRGLVTTWLERSEQQPSSGVPVVTHPRVYEEELHVRDQRDRPA